MPSVLFINRVYPPAPGATGELLAELAPALAAEGWPVTVLTARPPQTGSASPPLAARPPQHAAVRLECAGGLPFTRASHLRRAFAYASLYPALLWRAWCLPRHDVVVLLTDPPLVFTLGPLIRLVKGSRLVHWAQDVYPEVAEELGVIRARGIVANTLRAIANFALKRFDRVITVGECMKAVLVARGLNPARVVMIPNWSDPALIRPVPAAENAFLREHAGAGEFVVMYSGNFGLAHLFEPVLDAAAMLQASQPRVRFLLVGSGPRFAEVSAGAAERGLKNVRFLPPVPRARLAESLSAADAHVVTMRDGLCGLVVPSKIYGVMAAGRPLVFLGPADSEAAITIRRERCGVVLAPEDASGLARTLAGWVATPVETQAMGERARRAAEAGGLTAAIPAFRDHL